MGELGLAIALVVRLYDNGALTAADRAAVAASASAILLAAEVPTSWPDCAPPKLGHGGSEEQDSPYAVCTREMGAGEIAVRFQRTPLIERMRGDMPLGYAHVDTGRREGALATIYLDRVEALAASAGIDWRIVLGRAIAHEIGHLLLGTNTHAGSGLMRAVWSRHTLRANRPLDWVFEEGERVELVRALGRRGPVTQAAENAIWTR